jgi:cell division septation protein DedD
MTSLPNLQQYTELPELERDLARQAGSMAGESAVEPAEFEIVLGHRQVAGTALLAIVLLAVVCGVSYSIGKSMVAAAPAAISQAPAVSPAPAVSAAPALPHVAPAVSRAPALPLAPKEQIKTNTAPLFGEAVPGQVYFQMGIITKGSAVTWVEGLRGHGLDAFVAPGPDDGLGMWRVLVGPLPNPTVYQQAKNTLDALAVPYFGRTF